MKIGDGTEMGEVIHSTLKPSLLSDQILMLGGWWCRAWGDGDKILESSDGAE